MTQDEFRSSWARQKQYLILVGGKYMPVYGVPRPDGSLHYCRTDFSDVGYARPGSWYSALSTPDDKPEK